MALTDAQKAQARRYCGFADVNRQYDLSLEGAMGALSAEGEALVVDLLGQLATLQTKLASSWDRQKVLRAEEVTLAGGDEIRALRAEGNRLAGDLAAALQVTPKRSAFGGDGGSGMFRSG